MPRTTAAVTCAKPPSLVATTSSQCFCGMSAKRPSRVTPALETSACGAPSSAMSGASAAERCSGVPRCRTPWEPGRSRSTSWRRGSSRPRGHRSDPADRHRPSADQLRPDALRITPAAARRTPRALRSSMRCSPLCGGLSQAPCSGTLAWAVARAQTVRHSRELFLN